MAGFPACDEKHHFLYDPLLYATLHFELFDSVVCAKLLTGDLDLG